MPEHLHDFRSLPSVVREDCLFAASRTPYCTAYVTADFFILNPLYSCLFILSLTHSLLIGCQFSLIIHDSVQSDFFKAFNAVSEKA